jgi:hypothetical protein
MTVICCWRWNYRRMAFIVAYIFYKNILMSIFQ